jgi:hypothetical protein
MARPGSARWPSGWTPGAKSTRGRRRRGLDAKPSEYLNRNVRVTPFYFEKIATYFERFPHLSNIYSFASDYPHPEGGKDVLHRFHQQLAPLGEEVCRKFFHENEAWLLPD